MIKINGKSAFFALIASLGAIFWGAASAQTTLPATIDVPVTFYDFHSDRSNPEFEQPHQGGRRMGMVANTLDADFKPQIGPSPYRNYGIAHWFRDWNAYTAGPYSRGKNMAPVYDPTPGIRQNHNNEWDATVTYLGDRNVGHDTSFKNIVIPGVLTFTLVPGRNDGMYEFSRRGNNQFFFLDGRGFGNEWAASVNNNSNGRAAHNYSFTMELVFQFQAKPNMEFNFEGDDDVWVFIDNRLVLDIGGIHRPVADRFNVSSVPGVTVGGYHTLRVFYAERHTDDANIWIQTNIVAPPSSINISTTGNTTGTGIITGSVDKPADQKTTLYSVVYDDLGRIMTPGEYDCNDVSWRIAGREVGRGCSLTVADSIAGALEITATYNDRKNPPVTKTVGMNVKALPPASIHVQTSLDPKNPLKDKLTDDVYFDPSKESATVYAVLRDRYGNYVGLAELRTGGSNDWTSQGTAQWTITETEVATVGQNRGSGQATGSSTTVWKEFLGEGTQTTIIVRYTVCGGTLSGCVTLVDSAYVGSKGVGRIAIGPVPLVPGVTQISDTYPPKTVDFYTNVIKNSTPNGSQSGILIAIDAPKRLDEARGGATGAAGAKPYGKVIIYDAVGNVVKTAALYEAGRATSYGYVWDGKNLRGRLVGPGTYLVRVTGRDADGKTLYVQRKVGVTKTK